MTEVDEIISDFGEMEVWEKLRNADRISNQTQINNTHQAIDNQIWHAVYGEIELVTFKKFDKDVS